ncbi:MAG: serine/threonine protein kinase [Sandaracinus sp.]|nr:serine/threonine protein kinase [Sandaracinus sp.]MCB9624560.1 serine/threonine protein kinase [Sandaracinus sp.]
MGDKDLSAIPAIHGRYAFVKALGSGGMGEVALVRDERIGREVALKILQEDEAADAEIRGRFVREARIQARLEHPGLVPVYDLGETEGEDEPAWFTMRRVRGVTLQDVLSRARDNDESTRFGRTRLLGIFVQMCRAIDFAHSRGVVHRDLKPANVMVGEFGEVYVLDWGVAKLVDRPASTTHPGTSDIPDDDLDETREGSALGTPGYMSPEQALGDAEVGPASDVYALGCILYEILTLEKINTGKSSRERIAQAIEGVDARIARRFPDRRVSPELEAVCVEATHVDSTKRLRSARSLADRVEEFLEGDRDLERRQKLSYRHVRRAHAAMAEGGGGQSVATRELALALALDPENHSAASELASLLLEPPTSLPDGARSAFGRWVENARRVAARATASRYVLWLSLAPFGALLLGVRLWPMFSVATGLLALAATLTVLQARGVVRGVAVTIFSFATAALALVCFSTIFGPFVLLPCLLATNLMYHAAHVGHRQRLGLMSITAIASLLAIFGHLLGLWPCAVEVTNEGILVRAGMMDFPPEATWWVLVVTNVLAALVPALTAGQTRDAVVRAERRLVAHAWTVQQLVPEAVRRRYDGQDGVMSDVGGSDPAP